MTEDRSRRKDFGILFVVLMTVASGNTALQAVLPAIGRELGLRDTLVTAVFSLSALLYAVSAPLWARVSDRRGRKRLIEMGLLGHAVSMAGFGVVVWAGMRGLMGPMTVFVGLLLVRAIYGLTGSAAQPASQAYVADRTTPEERTNAFALLASAFGLGTVLGPAVAPFMALPPFGLLGPLFGFAVIGAVVLAVTERGLKEPQLHRGQAAPAAKGLWRDPRVRPFLIYGFGAVSVQAVNIASLGFVVIDTVEMPPAQAQSFIGAALMAGAASGLLAQWGLIRMLNMSPRALMRWGAGLAVLGNLALAFAPDYGTVVFSYALMNLGYGFLRPGFTAGSSLAVGPGDQGAVAGLLTSMVGAAFIASPVVGVALYEWEAPAPFLINAAVCLSLLFYAMASPALKRATVRAEPSPSLA